MTSIVFVHGTGTRRLAYEQALKIIQEKVGAHAKVETCLWGDAVGTRLHASGKSIPTYNSARAVCEDEIPAGESDDYEIALWFELYRNPLYELSMLCSQPSQTEELFDGKPAMVEKLVQFGTIRSELLESYRISEQYQRASEYVVNSPDFAESFSRCDTDTRSFAELIARAVIAAAIIICDNEDTVNEVQLAGHTRDALVKALADHLSNSDRGIEDLLWKPVLGSAAFLGTSYATRKRGVLSDAAFPCVGDVVLYQARGEEIRNFIKEAIESSEPPVVVLAHSLGGIATADLLIRNDIDCVKQFVTIGTQIAVLYEMDALWSLRYGQSLPDHFPPWTNFYDLRDLLSYIGNPVLGDKVRDIQLDNRQPFPRSHGAYWGNQKFWEMLIEIVRSQAPVPQTIPK